jgi:hypothetical protein
MEDTSRQYGQQDFNLPHDVVTLPSKGKFYKNKKKSLKVGYLTAHDENILISASNNDNIVRTLLKNKIYEPDFNVDELLESDVEAILIFLRNTSFGPEYNFTLRDPKTSKEFKKTILLDELDITEPTIEPNNEGLFEFILPKSGKRVLCRILNIGDINEINNISSQYPEGMVAPIVTKRLEKHIVSVDDITDREEISKFIINLPIADSKFIRNKIKDCEPRLKLNRIVNAPSGEKVEVRITFGAEFFRPFF